MRVFYDKRKRAVVVFIVMRFRFDYKLLSMRMDRYFLTTPRNELLTRHTFFFKDPQTLNEHFLFFSFFLELEFWSFGALLLAAAEREDK